MKKFTRAYKKIKLIYIQVATLAIIVNIFFLPSFMKVEKEGDNIFNVFLNNTAVGVVGDEKCIEEYLRDARKMLAKTSDEIMLVDMDIRTEGREVYFGLLDSPKDVTENMLQVIEESAKVTRKRSYTLKINEFTVNLASSEDVLELLRATLKKYDTEEEYTVDLALDTTRELNVLTTEIKSAQEEADGTEEDPLDRKAGFAEAISDIFETIEPEREKEFEDYELGLTQVSFGDTVEVVEAYLLESELTPLSQAIEMVTKDQEKNKIYEVMPGDTLSGIAMNNDLTVERLVEINENIETADSMIRAGDEIIVTVPEPELSVQWTSQEYYEEDYEAEIVYVPNDSWYITDQVTLQEPSAGHRRVVADVNHRNNMEEERTILKEEIVMEAVPKIIERGTKIPPTYIKPISGGRISSRFGGRKAPTKGASTYHRAVDWAVPTGTAVAASGAGTVTKAGWGSGYGYVVYIRHADGRETRYAHLSKVLVKAGQSVSQGQKIALSGNTGRSTGPHLHFEMLIGGSQVDPLKYLN